MWAAALISHKKLTLNWVKQIYKPSCLNFHVYYVPSKLVSTICTPWIKKVSPPPIFRIFDLRSGADMLSWFKTLGQRNRTRSNVFSSEWEASNMCPLQQMFTIHVDAAKSHKASSRCKTFKGVYSEWGGTDWSIAFYELGWNWIYHWGSSILTDSFQCAHLSIPPPGCDLFWKIQ